MIWLLALLQVADWLTTRTILQRGRELNPVMRGLIRLTGSADVALIAKGAAVTGAGWLVIRLSSTLCARSTGLSWGGTFGRCGGAMDHHSIASVDAGSGK